MTRASVVGQTSRKLELPVPDDEAEIRRTSSAVCNELTQLAGTSVAPARLMQYRRSLDPSPEVAKL
ncbi:MAG: hypothetical protein AB7P03_21080 [Kofleriaceae bacterium]